jgi:hypothetical protein
LLLLWSCWISLICAWFVIILFSILSWLLGFHCNLFASTTNSFLQSQPLWWCKECRKVLKIVC